MLPTIKELMPAETTSFSKVPLTVPAFIAFSEGLKRLALSFR